MSSGIVLVGAGLAAQRCAERLRRDGFDGPIRMVGAEPHPPYGRPPLSKGVLGTGDTPAPPVLRPPGWYRDNDVELLLGDAAADLDPGARRVVLASGATVRYRRLLVCSGARARRLPLLEGYDNVLTLRGFDDALALRALLGPGRRLAIVGAGFIGLEVASAVRARGGDVTVVDVAPVPLAAVLGSRLGRWIERLHREHGVHLRLRVGLTAVHAAEGRVHALTLSDGARIPCDAVLVAIGTAPATEWLARTGLDTGGLVAATDGTTAVPGVYAAGDAARAFDPLTGRHERTEHWEAAAWQGGAAARAMLGADPGPPPLPSFWSDQHGVRLQLLGRARGDAVTVESDDPGSRRLVAWFHAAGRPVGALLAGAPELLPGARRLLREAQTAIGAHRDHRRRGAA